MTRLRRSVTPREFNEWLKNNIKYTWYHGKEGGYRSKDGSPLIKYFYPKLDTRDMRIFRIDTHPERFMVDFRDDFNGTILDHLDYKIKEEMKKRDEYDL